MSCAGDDGIPTSPIGVTAGASYVSSCEDGELDPIVSSAGSLLAGIPTSPIAVTAGASEAASSCDDGELGPISVVAAGSLAGPGVVAHRRHGGGLVGRFGRRGRGRAVAGAASTASVGELTAGAAFSADALWTASRLGHIARRPA